MASLPVIGGMFYYHGGEFWFWVDNNRLVSEMWLPYFI